MYRLDSEQGKIVEKIAKIADDEIAPHASKVDSEGVFPGRSIQALAKNGFLGLTVPGEFGGMGQGFSTVCAVLDQIAQRCASTAMIYQMHICGVACYAARPGSAEAQLRAAAKGEHLSTLAWSERGSRSNFWAPVSQESVHNGSVRLNAEKSWVTSADHADGYVVLTRWSQAQSPTDSMAYLVLKNDPGLTVEGPWDGLGMRGNASAPMRLKDVAVDSGRSLSSPGKAFEEIVLGVVLPRFHLGLAAISCGIAERAITETQRHLTGKRLEHMGGSLADLPTLRARLAQMRIETDRARAHVVATLDAVENGSEAAQLYVLEVKSQAAEMAFQVTDLGMSACGGAAFSKHMALERCFRDARAAAVMAPTTDHAKEFIGRTLCNMELFG